MPDSVSIRRAEREDAPQLAALYLQTAPEAVEREPTLRRIPSRESLEAVYHGRTGDPERCVFLASIGDAAAGFVDVRLGRVGEDATLSRPMTYGYVEEIVVAESQRRKGVARRLMDAAHRWIRDQGGAAVFLDTHLANDPAQRLYLGLGYRAIGTIYAYEFVRNPE